MSTTDPPSARRDDTASRQPSRPWDSPSDSPWDSPSDSPWDSPSDSPREPAVESDSGWPGQSREPAVESDSGWPGQSREPAVESDSGWPGQSREPAVESDSGWPGQSREPAVESDSGWPGQSREPAVESDSGWPGQSREPAVESDSGWPGQSREPAVAIPWGQPDLSPQHAGFDSARRSEFADPGSRLAARIIDGVILFLISLVEGLFIMLLSNDSLALMSVMYLFTFAGFICYFIGFTALRGQTPGKMVMHIKVVREDDGGNPGWGKAFARELLPMLLYLTFFGYLICVARILWNDNRQGWHDSAAGTYVIKT